MLVIPVQKLPGIVSYAKVTILCHMSPSLGHRGLDKQNVPPPNTARQWVICMWACGEVGVRALLS